MVLPEKYILVRKDVKHARMRVSEDGHIRVIVPNGFTEEDIDALIKKKKAWVEKNERFFKGMSRIELQRNQLLLFGNRYSYFYDSSYERKVILDHVNKTIRTKRNLLTQVIQVAWYKSIAKKYLQKRTEELAKNLDFRYETLYIRNQKKEMGQLLKREEYFFKLAINKSSSICD